ncbi:post-transcriptional regulator [Robertmurraya sp. P23]|uniref:post-transcriptional regulator n=1 Tax=Robertmurraya sp. P23 TaxID=3436931 RepID=UPI003D99584D
MEMDKSYDRFRKEVHPALISKIEEFSLLGYGTISQDSLWEFLSKKKWRKPKEDVKVYEVVSDILSVNVGEYMNYATVEAFKSDEFSLANDEERRELLK